MNGSWCLNIGISAESEVESNFMLKWCIIALHDEVHAGAMGGVTMTWN